LEQLWAERERQDEEIEKVWSRWIFSRPTILPCLQAVEDEKQKLVDEAASEVAAMAKCVEEASRLEAEVRRDSFPHLVHILYSCPFNDSEAQNKSELASQQILCFFHFFSVPGTCNTFFATHWQVCINYGISFWMVSIVASAEAQK
jgi:hypothetical protein